MSKEIGDEYSSSLSDLTMNSKPLINMLTILAEENVEHAAVIVQSVEKHLDKVHPDIKLPVLYLVDSIIKNVGGAYTQLFSQIIVGMFVRVFKQVDERIRSQMFKLRETWHDVFPSGKLYQLDVKVSLIDPAWPIQTQKAAANNIHVNPNFLMKSNPASANATVASTSTAPVTLKMTTEDEEMLNAVAMKEQELLLLQKKKIELKLEQATKRLENSKNLGTPLVTKPVQVNAAPEAHSVTVPSAVVAVPPKPKKPLQSNVTPVNVPGSIKIAPVSPVLLSNARRRDPRLARSIVDHPPASDLPPVQNISSFDTKPFKSEKNSRFARASELGNDLSNKSEKSNSRQLSTKKDPRVNRHKDVESSNKSSNKSPSLTLAKARSPAKGNGGDLRFADKRKKSDSPPRTNKLPPIPKIKCKPLDCDSPADHLVSPLKSKKEGSSRSGRKRKSKSNSFNRKRNASPNENKVKVKPLKYEAMDVDPLERLSPAPTDVAFKELKFSTKDRNYMRRNREKSESPDKLEANPRVPNVLSVDNAPLPTAAVDVIGNGVTSKDVDLRLMPAVDEPTTAGKKRISTDKREDSPAKKSKAEKFDALFGDEDVDLRKLPLVDNLTPPPGPPSVSKKDMDPSVLSLDLKGKDSGWAKVKEGQSPNVSVNNKSHLSMVRAKLAETTKGKDPLGRPLLYKYDKDQDMSTVNSEDTDMRLQAISEMESESFGSSIKTILSQADENLKSGEIDDSQYSYLLRQVWQISEAQKLKEAQRKDSVAPPHPPRKKLSKSQKRRAKQNQEIIISDEDDLRGTFSPRYDELDSPNRSPNYMGVYGDIDERVVQHMMPDGKRPALLPRPDMPHLDYDIRKHPHDPHDGFMPRSERFGRYGQMRKGWRGMRQRMEERAMYRPPGGGRALPPPPPMGRRNQNMRFEEADHMMPLYKAPEIGVKQIPFPLPPYNSSGRASPPLMGSPQAMYVYNPVDNMVFDYIELDSMKTRHIDGKAREIRYYDRTAIIMMNWDDPREISFEVDDRRVFIDDESYLLQLNEEYINITIDGVPHAIRFGGPTRELYIDDTWFECFFGEKPMPIVLDNKVKYLKLEGPPPKVSIGKVKRTDLIVGKINMIIDATLTYSVFLDPKLQRFDVDGIPHLLRFVDSLKTILIDEKPYKVEFGGLPKPVFIGKRKHFMRFSVLPHGIKPGFVDIKNMEGFKPPMLPANLDLNSITIPPLPALKALNLDLNIDPMMNMDVHSESAMMPDEAKVSDMTGGLDMLASVLPSSMAPASQFSGYSVANFDGSSIPGLEQSAGPATIPSVPSESINVIDLFAKLVETGIVPSVPVVSADVKPDVRKEKASTKVPEKVIAKDPTSVMSRVNLLKSETLKIPQPGLIGLLHTGMQCGSCGVRFPPEHTVRYSQHLDWHFRQNRADRHSQRRPNSRKWYYDISDWIQYQEIEDLEEREKSWFEQEQQAIEAAKTEEAAAVAARRETSSVPMKSEGPPELLRCQMCHDSFNQFYDHDTDEWHLRNAVEHEGSNYHPICLDDYKTSLMKSEKEPEEEEESKTLIDLDKDTESADAEEPPKETEESQPSPKAEERPAEESAPKDESAEESSLVEVLAETATQESVIEVAQDGDVEVLEEDDDVIIKNEPVEQIVVEDADTDEETEKERQERDTRYLAEIPADFANVKIKQEPLDPDDEPIITSEEVMMPQADTTHATVLSSIDGNVQLEPTVNVAPVIPTGGIKINITKTLVAPPPKGKDSPRSMQGEPSPEPPPPGEEPEIVYKLKPTLEGYTFTVRPPIRRGNELSGLCSIM